jgi:imidazolonepropionase-like amidohydrolase
MSVRQSSIALLCGAALISGCAQQDFTYSSGTIITGVTVVDTRDGTLTPDRAVVIDNGKIVKISGAGTVHAVGVAKVFSATGKFVVPGYLDMHAHVVEGADAPVPPWPLLIANGITGFRQMSGSPELLERGQRLREEIAAGTVVAPEPLALVGRLFNLAPEGGRPGITTPAMAIQEVRDQKQAGTDFIKVINVSGDVFFATAKEAKAQGLDLVGHLFPAVSGTAASNAGMRAYEHLGGTLGNIIFDCSSDEVAVRQGLITEALARSARPGPPPTPQSIRRYLATPTAGLRQGEVAMIQRALDTYSEDRCRELARLLAKNGTWQPATLIRLKTMLMPGEFQNDPDLKYVAPPLRAMWREVLADFDGLPAAWKDTFKQLYEYDLRMMNLFKEEGVKVLAGDDLGGGWVVTGFGLHQEFRELSKAGLSPLEVLQTATLNPAEFLRREPGIGLPFQRPAVTPMGTVEEGNVGDLVLLDADPTASVENLDRISGVVLKGRYFPKVELDKMKDTVEKAYRR